MIVSINYAHINSKISPLIKEKTEEIFLPFLGISE